MTRDRLTWWAYGVIASFAFVLNGFGPVGLVDRAAVPVGGDRRRGRRG